MINDQVYTSKAPGGAVQRKWCCRSRGERCLWPEVRQEQERREVVHLGSMQTVWPSQISTRVVSSDSPRFRSTATLHYDKLFGPSLPCFEKHVAALSNHPGHLNNTNALVPPSESLEVQAWTLGFLKSPWMSLTSATVNIYDLRMVGRLGCEVDDVSRHGAGKEGG